MGIKYQLTAYDSKIRFRWTVYSGDSIWGVLRAYCKGKKKGYTDFVFTWWI